MIKPTIHLNGSSRENLLEGYQRAVDALDEAASALRATAPNGRDYYVQDGNFEGQALGLATTEHRSRLERLESVAAELQELAEHVANAPKRGLIR